MDTLYAKLGIYLFLIGVIFGFVLGFILCYLLTPSKKNIPLPSVSKRLENPDLELIRENNRLRHLLPRLEKESKFFKQEADRWRPKPIAESEADIDLAEAENWLR